MRWFAGLSSCNSAGLVACRRAGKVDRLHYFRSKTTVTSTPPCAVSMRTALVSVLPSADSVILSVNCTPIAVHLRHDDQRVVLPDRRRGDLGALRLERHRLAVGGVLARRLLNAAGRSAALRRSSSPARRGRSCDRWSREQVRRRSCSSRRSSSRLPVKFGLSAAAAVPASSVTASSASKRVLMCPSQTEGLRERFPRARIGDRRLEARGERLERRRRARATAARRPSRTAGCLPGASRDRGTAAPAIALALERLRQRARTRRVHAPRRASRPESTSRWPNFASTAAADFAPQPGSPG